MPKSKKSELYVVLASYQPDVTEDDQAVLFVGTEKECNEKFDEFAVGETYATIMVCKVTSIAKVTYDYEDYAAPTAPLKEFKVKGKELVSC